MTSPLSVILYILIFVVLGALAVAAVYKPRLAWGVGSLFAALLVGLTVTHVGYSFGGDRPAAVPLSEGTASQLACQDALQTAERAGLILDRSNAERVIVRGNLWQRIPQEARDALTTCLSATATPGRPGSTVIVEQ